MIKIYLDVCCLSRPFDDHSQDRVCIEAEAILTILNRSRQGHWHLLNSEIIEFEISKIADDDKRQKVSILSSALQKFINVNDTVEKRAIELESVGIKPYDSLHIACAEYGKADVLLTTDDDLLRKASRGKRLNVRIENPVIWLMEVISK